MGNDLASIAANFAQSLRGPFWTLLFAVAALAGTVYAGHVLWKLIRNDALPGRPVVSGGEVLAVLVVAAILINFSGFMGKVSESAGMGPVSYGPIDYPGAQAFGELAPAINAALTLASMGGGVFALRGVFLLKKAVSGGGHAGEDAGWSALTHIVGGAFLINIVQLIDALRQSTGGLW